MPRGGNGGNNGGNTGGSVIRGNNKDNVISGTNGDDVIEGRGGFDILSGNDGNDTINGGDGDDILIGGAGDDVLTGGNGADIFVVDANSDTITITDFENGVDRIDIQAFNIDPQNPFAGQYIGYLANVGADTILTFYDTNSQQQVLEITLENFDYTLIDVSDYIV